MKSKTFTMWALPWLTHGGKNLPSVYIYGAWKMFTVRDAALKEMQEGHKKPIRVRVKILK